MSTYLTIDLDYWAYSGRTGMKDFLRKTFKKTAAPVVLINHHDRLLDDMNKYRFDRMINIDYHSDICTLDEDTDLNEGTWACFINKRSRGHFEWRCPSMDVCYKIGRGRCERLEDGNVFHNPKAAGWKELSVRQGLRELPFEDVIAIGICASPHWWLSYGKEKDEVNHVLGWLTGKKYRGMNRIFHWEEALENMMNVDVERFRVE